MRSLFHVAMVLVAFASVAANAASPEGAGARIMTIAHQRHQGWGDWSVEVTMTRQVGGSEEVRHFR